jgi:zinc protease
MGKVNLAIGERTLGNGLTVMAVQNEGVQTFASAVVLSVDVRDEIDADQGVTQMIGDCLDEGTVHRDAVELAKAVDEIGGSLSGNASGGGIMCPEKHSMDALRMMREMVFEPAFSEREVQRVRDETLQDIKVEEADPRQVASMRFHKEVYGNHPYSRPSRGDAEAVASHTSARLLAFHQKWYAPVSGIVAASGPAEVEASLDVLEREFQDLSGTQPEHLRPEDPLMPEPGVDVHIAMEREQVHVFLGHPGIRRGHPDFYSLMVMDYILGTGPGFTSRIAKRLRDEMGLCYSVNAAITSSAGEEPGVFAAYIGTSPEHREKAIAGFCEEIDRIRGELVTAKELQDVQDYLTGSYIFGFERNTQLARYAVRAKRFGLGFDYIHRYPELIRAVTCEDVQRVAQKHLHPDRMVRVSAGAS